MPSLPAMPECLFHHHGISYIIASQKKSTSWQMQSTSGPGSWNSLVLPTSPPPEATGKQAFLRLVFSTCYVAALWRCGEISFKMQHKRLINCFFRSISRIWASRNQGLETSDSWWSMRKIHASCVFEFRLCFYLEILIPKGGMLPSGETAVTLLNWKLKLSPGHFRML